MNSVLYSNVCKMRHFLEKLVLLCADQGNDLHIL